MAERAPAYLEKLFLATAERTALGLVPDAVRQIVRVERNPSSRHWEYQIGNHPALLRLDNAVIRLVALVDAAEQPARSASTAGVL